MSGSVASVAATTAVVPVVVPAVATPAVPAGGAPAQTAAWLESEWGILGLMLVMVVLSRT